MPANARKVVRPRLRRVGGKLMLKPASKMIGGSRQTCALEQPVILSVRARVSVCVSRKHLSKSDDNKLHGAGHQTRAHHKKVVVKSFVPKHVIVNFRSRNHRYSTDHKGAQCTNENTNSAVWELVDVALFETTAEKERRDERRQCNHKRPEQRQFFFFGRLVANGHHRRRGRFAKKPAGAKSHRRR